MKDLMRAILLNVAIYSGAIFANSDDNIEAAVTSVICGVASSLFVTTNDKK